VFSFLVDLLVPIAAVVSGAVKLAVSVASFVSANDSAVVFFFCGFWWSTSFLGQSKKKNPFNYIISHYSKIFKNI